MAAAEAMTTETLVLPEADHTRQPGLSLSDIWKEVSPLVNKALHPKDNSRPQEKGVQLPARRHVNDIYICTPNW